jgi:hypothetical protein
MEGRFHKLDGPDRRSSQDRRSGIERRGSSVERGVFDWLQDEEREDRRNGKDRRSGRARRGTVANRLDERRTIPFSIAPRGEVRTEDGQHWHCTLWDLSRSGLCLVANGSFEPAPGCEFSVALYEVVGLGSVFFKATLRWFAEDEFETYLGLQFSSPAELPKGTFLERYFLASSER